MDTLQLLAANELLIADLYTAYGERFPEDGGMWTAMAEEEKMHSSWISDLDARVQSGAIRVDEKRFPREAILTYGKYVKAELAKAGGPDLTPVLALNVAFYLEQSLIERRFFEAIQGDAEIVRQTVSRLGEATRGHYQRIRQARDRSARPR